MTAIIDGDSIPYVVSSVAEKQYMTLSQAKSVADNIFKGILSATNSNKYILFMGGDKNFRSEIYPEYKATRQKYKSVTQGLYYDEITEYLAKEYTAYIVRGAEADDAVSITANRLNSRSLPCTIVTIDKDLLQCPGNHYNYKTKTASKVVNPGIVKLLRDNNNKPKLITTGEYHLWRQMIEGDTVDNIIGLKNHGCVKANEILTTNKLENIPDVILGLYIKQFGLNKGIELFQLNYRLINIIKESNTMLEVEPISVELVI